MTPCPSSHTCTPMFGCSRLTPTIGLHGGRGHHVVRALFLVRGSILVIAADEQWMHVDLWATLV